MSTMTPSPIVPPRLRGRVLARVAAIPARTRAEGRRRVGLAFAVASLPPLSLFVAWGGTAHAEGRPYGITVVLAIGALLAAGACAALAWGRGGSMLGRPVALLALPPLLLPALTFGWLVAFHARYVEPFARVGYRCAALSLLGGGAILAAALWLRRGSATRSAPIAGASLGAMGASFGAVLVDLWCPLTNAPHALVGHVLPIVVLALAGAGLGAAILRPRARA